MGQKENERYRQKVVEASPRSPSWKNCFFAFVVGGGICTVGQGLKQVFGWVGMNTEVASSFVSIILIFCSALFTGIGWYDDLAKHAGAGTLVPITGFANAVVSPALEYKTEGMVTGVAAKMFIISGPVIVYGILSAAAVGLIRLIFQLVMGG